MIEDMLNNYGYDESGTDNLLMDNVLTSDNTIGSGNNIPSPTEKSFEFENPDTPVGCTPMGTIDIMSYYE